MRFVYFMGFLCLALSRTLHASDSPRLSVSGHATISKPADALRLTVGIVTYAQAVDLAVKSNNEKMRSVIAALQRAGVTQKEMQPGSYTVLPQYAPAPKTPPPDWQPSIAAYEVRNILSIRTNQLELAGAIIEAASKNGANLVQDITFSLEKSQDAEVEAINQAIQQIYVYATAAAKSAGVSLGDVQTLDLNPVYITPRFLKAEGVNLAVQESSSVVLPKDVEISANVSMTFSIAPISKQ